MKIKGRERERKTKGRSVGNIVTCRAARSRLPPVPVVARDGEGEPQKTTGGVAATLPTRGNPAWREARKDESEGRKTSSLRFAGMLHNLDAALCGP